jgi:trigger factor
MKYESKALDKGMVEFTFEVPVEELKNDLERAAAHLTEHHPIDGFRAGKTPYDVVVQRLGEAAIYEEALPVIVRHAYVKAVQESRTRAYGQPEIGVKTLVPGSAVVFTATVPVLPAVTATPELSSVQVAAKEIKVDPKDVEETLKELQKMQTKEVKVERELREGDKAVVDMDLTKGGVPMEGGQARNHGIYLDEEYYIPGLKEQVIGQRIGEARTFTLKFPETHFQKHLAGQDIEFRVDLKEVYEMDHPAIDEEFAKKLGKQSLQELREVLTENMRHEMEEKERQRRELEALEQLVDKSTVGDIPEVAINDEVNRMLQEMEEGVTQRGGQFDDYLKSLGKSIMQLKLDFVPQAIKRIKTSLIIDALGDKLGVEADEAEIAAEVEKAVNASADDAEAQARYRDEEYEDYVRWRLRNRRVLEIIREKTTKA